VERGVTITDLASKFLAQWSDSAETGVCVALFGNSVVFDFSKNGNPLTKIGK